MRGLEMACSPTDGGNVWGCVIDSVGQYVDALQLRERWRVSISLPGSSGHQVANWWRWGKEIATYMISEKPMRKLEFSSDRLIEAYGKRIKLQKISTTWYISITYIPNEPKCPSASVQGKSKCRQKEC
ncbi:hypothetical protein ACFX2B_041478 [Malus domestica]